VACWNWWCNCPIGKAVDEQRLRLRLDGARIGGVDGGLERQRGGIERDLGARARLLQHGEIDRRSRHGDERDRHDRKDCGKGAAFVRAEPAEEIGEAAHA
jgi:hypothetical protein